MGFNCPILVLLSIHTLSMNEHFLNSFLLPVLCCELGLYILRFFIWAFLATLSQVTSLTRLPGLCTTFWTFSIEYSGLDVKIPILDTYSILVYKTARDK